MKRTPLKRKTPLGRKPRAKGNKGELEVREALRSRGYASAKRNLQSGGQGGGDIIEGIPGYSIEVKRHEDLNLWKAIKQSEEAASPTETALVVFRRNKGEWWATLDRGSLMVLQYGYANRAQVYHERDWQGQNIRLWVELAKTVAAQPLGAIPVLHMLRKDWPWYSCLPFAALLDLIEGQRA